MNEHFVYKKALKVFDEDTAILDEQIRKRKSPYIRFFSLCGLLQAISDENKVYNLYEWEEYKKTNTVKDDEYFFPKFDRESRRKVLLFLIEQTKPTP